MKPIGLTRDTGWQIGVRRTLPIELEAAWDMLLAPEGYALWLGRSAGDSPIAWETGAAYDLVDGSRGEVRVVKPQSHVRLTWQPPGWDRPSTIQLRVIPKDGRTVIALHQEHLPDAAARTDRQAFFAAALDQLQALV